MIEAKHIERQEVSLHIGDIRIPDLIGSGD